MNGIHATLIGRAGHDPEMQYLPDSGDPAVRLRVGVRDYRQNEAYTEWVGMTFYGRAAEFVNQHVHKGARIAVSGQLRLENYTRRDGTAGSGLVMRPNQRPQIIDWPSDTAEGGNAATASGGDAATTAAAADAPAGNSDEDIDDLPF